MTVTSDTNKNRLLLTLFFGSIPVSLAWCALTGQWFWLLISLVIFQMHKIIGNNVAMHRYFSHRSFSTGPLRHKFLSYYTILLGAKSPITWAMNHRHHHRFADQPQDTHNPNQDFWSTALGLWEFRSYDWFKHKGVAFSVRDLMRDPVLVWIEQNYYKVWTLLLVIAILIDWRIALFGLLVPAGYYHIMANLFNTIGHYRMPGSYRNFDTPDLSQNNWVWGLLTMGEGFHNNHHHDQTCYSNHVKWHEFDLTGWLIKWIFHKPAKIA